LNGGGFVLLRITNNSKITFDLILNIENGCENFFNRQRKILF
jgi:hypothetical protein